MDGSGCSLIDYVSWMITEAEERTSSRLVLNGGGLDNVSEDLRCRRTKRTGARGSQRASVPVFYFTRGCLVPKVLRGVEA